MNKTVIIDGCRTPIGKWGGSLKNETAVDLGATCVKELLQRVRKKVTPEMVKELGAQLAKKKTYLVGKEDNAKIGLVPALREYLLNSIDEHDPAMLLEEAVIGNVLSAGMGQNPARQILLHGGGSRKVPASTVNHVCGSGMKAIINATREIALGESTVMLAGGSESMSNAPYLLKNRELNHRLGDLPLIDSVQHDGLCDAFHGYAMGITAENLAQSLKLTRTEQDEFAYHSQLKAARANEQGNFLEESFNYVLKPTKKESQPLFSQDEYIRGDMQLEKLATLKPVFVSEGSVTAGNSSGINDGAAMVYLMGSEQARNMKISPLATIEATTTIALDERIMGYGPVIAIKEVLKKTGFGIGDMSSIEINEAFAAQVLSVLKGLDLGKESFIPNEKKPDELTLVNPYGGAIALGHPIGCSGARIVVTLAYTLNRIKANQSSNQTVYGIASLCVGGGQGCAIMLSV